jgi:hypothetical protein
MNGLSRLPAITGRSHRPSHASRPFGLAIDEPSNRRRRGPTRREPGVIVLRTGARCAARCSAINRTVCGRAARHVNCFGRRRWFPRDCSWRFGSQAAAPRSTPSDCQPPTTRRPRRRRRCRSRCRSRTRRRHRRRARSQQARPPRLPGRRRCPRARRRLCLPIRLWSARIRPGSGFTSSTTAGPGYPPIRRPRSSTAFPTCFSTRRCSVGLGTCRRGVGGRITTVPGSGTRGIRPGGTVTGWLTRARSTGSGLPGVVAKGRAAVSTYSCRAGTRSTTNGSRPRSVITARAAGRCP